MKTNLLPHLSADKANDLRGEFIRNFWPVIGTANQCAALWLLDCYDELEDAGLLKKEIKKSANSCSKAIDTYYRTARLSLGDRFPIWSDLCNNATHNIYPDCMKLYYCVKSAIDRNEHSSDIPSEIRAKVFTVHALIQVANAMYDSLTKKYQSQTVYNIHKNFDSARFSAVMHHWDELTKHFSKCHGCIDLNKDDKCQMSIKVILNRFGSKEFINEAAGDAIRQNPAMHKHLTEQEYKDIVENGTKEKDTTQSESKAEE